MQRTSESRSSIHPPFTVPQARIHHPLRPRRTTNNMKFTGHERDPETNLDYMLARYYTSGSGRFLQVDPGYDYDPTDPMSFNLYGYVRGNPVGFHDPTGAERKKGKTPNKKWPKLPKNLGGKKPKWNREGYWEGKNGKRLTWGSQIGDGQIMKAPEFLEKTSSFNRLSINKCCPVGWVL